MWVDGCVGGAEGGGEGGVMPHPGVLHPPHRALTPAACPLPLPPPPPQAVTKNKLGYDPVEVDPEDMVGGWVGEWVAVGCVRVGVGGEGGRLLLGGWW